MGWKQQGSGSVNIMLGHLEGGNQHKKINNPQCPQSLSPNQQPISCLSGAHAKFDAYKN